MSQPGPTAGAKPEARSSPGRYLSQLGARSKSLSRRLRSAEPQSSRPSGAKLFRLRPLSTRPSFGPELAAARALGSEGGGLIGM